jgi:hypothetical protein
MAQEYEFIPGLEVAGGRIELWGGPPLDGHCAIGLDFALGLATGDYDAAQVLDHKGRQLAVAEGHWGEAFGEILLPMIQYFSKHHPAFVVGEASQSGIAVLRELFDHQVWLYFHRAEEMKGRPVRDRLGHVPQEMDVTVTRLRQAIAPRGPRYEKLPPLVTIYDERTLDQLTAFQFLPRTTTIELEQARDEQLKWGAPPGEHDDLVRALALAWCGLQWLPQFDPPAPRYAPGTFGDLLGHGANAPVRKKKGPFDP